MAKRIPIVWTDRVRSRSSAPSTPSRPRRPCRRARRDDATSSAASTSPFRSNHTAASPSHVEPDLQHVAVDHLVVLALDAQLARVLGRLPRTEPEQLVPADHLGPDEPALQVGVDHPGAFRRLGAGPEGPRPALLIAGREERAPAQDP